MDSSVPAYTKTAEPQQVRESQHEALVEVFQQCCDSLYRFIIVRVGGDVDLAEDCMQQTLIEAHRARAIPAIEEIEFWLKGIARNLVRRHWRKRDYDQRAKESLQYALWNMDQTSWDASTLEDAELKELVLAAVTELPSLDQEIIVARYFDDHDLAEIATLTGLSTRAVEGRLYRARRQLKTMMQAQLGDDQ